jgi:hypothetical protein
VHGGGSLLLLHHSGLPSVFNQVYHPFRLSEIAENIARAKPFWAFSGLDPAVSDTVGSPSRRFIHIGASPRTILFAVSFPFWRKRLAENQS